MIKQLQCLYGRGVKNLKLIILNKSLNSDDLSQVINCLTFITTESPLQH